LFIGQHLQMRGINGKVAIVPHHRGAVIPDRCLGKDRRLAQRGQCLTSGGNPAGQIRRCRRRVCRATATVTWPVAPPRRFRFAAIGSSWRSLAVPVREALPQFSQGDRNSIRWLRLYDFAAHATRHPEEPRSCAASRRMAASDGAFGRFFEARREGRRAPQDDGGVCGAMLSSTERRTAPGHERA
jgi:hypothetical protein